MNSQEERKVNKPKVVVAGGGTGSFTVLSGLKYLDLDLNAIVSMADDGGSTGILRTELGSLPSGDLRQAILALADTDSFFLKLFNYRFEGVEDGDMRGHSLGNLVIAAAEQIAINESRTFDYALEKVHKLLNVRGRVMPVTTEKLVLMAESKAGNIFEGEHRINTDPQLKKEQIKRVFYKNTPSAHLGAIQAILSADLVVLCPGNVFCSIMPILSIPGIAEALKMTQAKVLMISNIMTKVGHTDNFSVYDFVQTYEEVVGQHFIDIVLHNSNEPSMEAQAIYQEEGPPVRFDHKAFSGRTGIRVIDADLLASEVVKPNEADRQRFGVQRTLIRHSPEKVATQINKILRG